MSNHISGKKTCDKMTDFHKFAIRILKVSVFKFELNFFINHILLI